MPTTTTLELISDVRAIAERTDYDGVEVPDLSGEEDRLIHDILGPGAIQSVAFAPVAGDSSTMNVVIGSGVAKNGVYVVDGLDSGQGRYLVRQRNGTDTVTLAAADPSQARTDEIYLVVLDVAYDAGSKSLPVLAVRKGDVGGAAPGPDASWTAYALLASVAIPAAAADITECTVTDQRTYSTLVMADGGSVPPGAIFPYGGSVAPLGYVFANGQALSRADYPRLFAAIGTTYGAGNGSTTFNVPDLRQRFPMGKAAAGTGNTLGGTGGALTHSHTGPAHTHSMSHTHNINPPNTATTSAGSHSHSQGSTGSAGSHGHTLTSAGEHNHPRAGQADTGFAPGAYLLTNSGSHTHGVSSAGSHTHSNPNTNSAGAHTHSVNIDQFTSGGASTSTTGSSGTGTTGTASSLPPYLVTNYIIKT